MNLGQIFFQTFLVLLVAPTLASILVLFLFRRKLSSKFSALALLCIFLGPVAGVCLNYKCHGIVFSAWHQSQNRFVPNSGNITYCPEFSRLYATYEMTLPQFHQWAATHPWKLNLSSGEAFSHDFEIMGLIRCYHPRSRFSKPWNRQSRPTANRGSLACRRRALRCTACDPLVFLGSPA